MELDIDKIDEATLALLSLGLHEGVRVWKSFDWDALHRLHEKGDITVSVRRNTLVCGTDGFGQH